MKKLLLIIIIQFFAEYSFSQGNLSAEDDNRIRQVMQMQEKAWNVGNIDQFMDGYWKSEQLVFVGAAGITYGWEATKEGYKKRYPDIKAMGKLTFDIISISKIDNSTAMLLGGFELQRIEDDLSGYFTLVWKNIDDEWLIISDHTTAKN